ncbi:biotin--[acetyl-CoA-carboxylase] ligase [Thermodesulfobacterium hydrogeniphilum]|uniref:biotin--[acetyl-CoA-carboxylase] ligase n=1 Tax=Thermodesulfobacterium hydrogeniphilum TaxID=161156 RepID=UPI0005713278|nr:biotin--[acetyl-CoA-carboxylase] ligase [Thermodesulfobacterium hydrogeniphilum]
MASLDYSKFFPEIGQEVWHFPSLSRAMALLKEFIRLFPKTANGRIIKADILLESKGRFNRKWFAEKGGLWVALSIYDEFLPENSCLIPLILGLALVRSAYHFGIKEAKIKWINDLHYKGKKIAGVLIEKFESWYIIGIGINVNNNPPEKIPAISFKKILKKEISLLTVLKVLIFWLRYYFGFLRFYERNILDEKEVKNIIIENYKKFSDTLKRCIAFSYNLDKAEEVLIGEVIDITNKGSLLINLENSEIVEVSSGEIIYLW